jgi:hypothetical protein
MPDPADTVQKTVTWLLLIAAIVPVGYFVWKFML